MKLTTKLKKKMVNNLIIYSRNEIESILEKENFFPIENDTTEDFDDTFDLKFTNCSYQIWVEVRKLEHETDDYFVENVKQVTKVQGQSTKVDPFHTYTDLKMILNYFYDNEKYNHWLCACLMVSLGRRVGDTLSLKYSDLFLTNGEFKDRLTTLKEEKTGKILSVRINEFAQRSVKLYMKKENITLSGHNYNTEIIKIGSAAFRYALKEAIEKVGINYPVSTHSFRKYYSNTMYKLHEGESDAIKMVQYQLGHSSDEITKNYIGYIDEKIDRYNKDYSDYLMNCANGKEPSLEIYPVISIKNDDLRELLKEAYQMGRDNIDDEPMEVMCRLMNKVDKLRIS